MVLIRDDGGDRSGGFGTPTVYRQYIQQYILRAGFRVSPK